jgi:DNA-directed RNA polymerase specialized sigma24 family protein
MNAPPENFNRLIEGRQQFLAFLEKRVESRAVAEDILQGAFVRGLEKSESLSDDESIVAWFYRILRNAVIEEGSLADLAGKADISANNAAVRVHRAREALRKQVTSACGACATHGCLDCDCKRQRK